MIYGRLSTNPPRSPSIAKPAGPPFPSFVCMRMKKEADAAGNCFLARLDAVVPWPAVVWRWIRCARHYYEIRAEGRSPADAFGADCYGGLLPFRIGCTDRSRMAERGCSTTARRCRSFAGIQAGRMTAFLMRDHHPQLSPPAGSGTRRRGRSSPV